MDTFLQSDADVYDDDLESEPVDLETQIQNHIVETSESEAVLPDQFHCPMEIEKDVEHEQFPLTELSDQEHQHYLERLVVIKNGMKKEDKELQERIDTMKRILELEDPMEQLAEYLTLKQEDRQDDNVNIVDDLLQCASRIMNIEDSEVATLGAFFFLSDRQRPKARVMTAMLPVVADMLEASSRMERMPFKDMIDDGDNDKARVLQH